MNEIHLDLDTYCANDVENCPQQCAKNIHKRIVALNTYYKHTDTPFENWKLDTYFINEYDSDLCICGHLIKETYIIIKNNVKCKIGNTCIKRFMDYLVSDVELIEEEIRKKKRKTEDCLLCGKRFPKETNHSCKCKIENCNNQKRDNSIYCIDCYDSYCDCGKSKTAQWKQCFNSSNEPIAFAIWILDDFDSSI
jgi:hypothetical protein